MKSKASRLVCGRRLQASLARVLNRPEKQAGHKRRSSLGRNSNQRLNCAMPINMVHAMVQPRTVRNTAHTLLTPTLVTMHSGMIQI